VAIAVINSIGNFGGFFGPYLMGYAKQMTGNLASGLYVLSGALILCSVLLFAFGLLYRRPSTSLHAPEQ
jgi:nitrate/nitrite transporter NarK